MSALKIQIKNLKEIGLRLEAINQHEGEDYHRMVDQFFCSPPLTCSHPKVDEFIESYFWEAEQYITSGLPIPKTLPKELQVKLARCLEKTLDERQILSPTSQKSYQRSKSEDLTPAKKLASDGTKTPKTDWYFSIRIFDRMFEILGGKPGSS